ncbi:MAG: substrate-binding domain-containing protein [Streptosporangiales bacterium]|nr:substrate-binding domain-containing protein [Streptosporangiales bacterium]MBO0892419.1 substrate-binding domain-containing protein [Acidothermales bacterium]
MSVGMRRWGVAIVATVAAVATVSACASPSNTGGSGTKDKNKKVFVVGYSQSNNAEPYRAQLNIQLKYYVKKYKNLKLLPITDAHQDSTTQVSQVQNFISQKVDVLIVSPNEPAPLAAAVQQACNQKIPVIILDRSVNTTCYTSFIGGDNVEAGKKAGELAAKELPNGGNVVELQGLLSDQPQIDRDKGFREGIKSNPKIKIIAHREAKWLKDDATRVMNQWLSQKLKVDLVYAQNDPMALGAQLAAASAGKDKSIKFIGTDGLAIPDGGIRAVQQGKLAGTFIYPTCAQQAAETAEAIVTGKKVPKKKTLAIEAVTPQNAGALYQKYDFSGKG